MTQITATRYRRATVAEPAPRLPESATSLRFASALGKATVLAVLAVALIVGILAMHSFASPVSHAEVGVSANSSPPVAASHHETAGAFAAAHPDCVGCGEDAAMAMMWCVLALLAGTLLLVAPRLLKGWVGAASSQLAIARPLFPVVSLVPLPPSLAALCISRT